MLLLGGLAGQASVAGSAAHIATAQLGSPYEAIITGTMPTDRETYRSGTLDIYDSAGLLVYSHTPNYRGRGNSTWEAPKKPFKVRSLNRQQRPFNMPASRDWALMADFYDESYIRSSVAFEIARRATGRWAALSRHLRVTWNGVYQGLYRYSETADVQPGRVDIRDMSNADIAGNLLTGPYFVERNTPLDEPGWTTARGSNILYDSPDVVGITQQEAYLHGWVDTLETALVAGTEAEILALVDVPSWVDWYLTAESTRNTDSNWSKSCKWIKDQDAPNGTGKAILWPPWDYDLSLGNQWFDGTTSQPSNPDGWHIRDSASSLGGSPNWLYYIWQKSPTFRAAVRAAWADRFRPTLLAIGAFIDEQAADVAPLVAEDRAKWKAGTARPSFHEASSIKSWLSTRTTWIQANLQTDP